MQGSWQTLVQSAESNPSKEIPGILFQSRLREEAERGQNKEREGKKRRAEVEPPSPLIVSHVQYAVYEAPLVLLPDITPHVSQDLPITGNARSSV